jgi:hypothetical protein
MSSGKVGLITVSAAGLLVIAALAQRVGRERRPGREVLDSAQHPPLAKDEAEKKIQSVLDDMHQNQRRGMMNVPVEDGRTSRPHSPLAATRSLYLYEAAPAGYARGTCLLMAAENRDARRSERDC